MVLEVNTKPLAISTYVVNFLYSNNAPEELIALWKDKNNIKKFKNVVTNIDQPPKPVRPKSKYLYFCDPVRKEIRKENPNMNIREVTCELGRRWRLFQLSPDPETDQKLSEAFEKDKKRYHEEKKPQVPSENKNRFRSKYLYFCEQERVKNPKITLKELSVLWNNTKDSPALFERYSKLFEDRKALYEASMAVKVE